MLKTRSTLTQTLSIRPEARQTRGMAAALFLERCLALPHAMAAGSAVPIGLGHQVLVRNPKSKWHRNRNLWT